MFEKLRQIMSRNPSNEPNFDVVLYTRKGCHLCEEADTLLRSHGLNPKPVDIDKDDQLREKFDCCVPVVEIDGRIRFRGKVNEILLRRLISRS